MNINFIERMIVDSIETHQIREDFIANKTIPEETVSAINSMTPSPFPQGWGTGPWRMCWGEGSLTMIPWAGLENLRMCLEDTEKNGIEGDFIETGVWRGGMCILAKCFYDLIKSDRKVFVADSFQGLPPPNAALYPQDAGDTHHTLNVLKVSQEDVQNNFRKFRCLDDKVVFLKGWFKDTLPTAPIQKLSILRLDGDMYESTINALEALYPKLSVGGYCIIDDYNHASCRAAVHDYRVKHSINDEIIKVDKNNASDEVHFWKKGNSGSIIDSKFTYWSSIARDMDQHMPTLKRYAAEVNHVTELGVRYIVSTWGFLAGRPKRMASLDIYHPSHYGANIDEVFEGCKEAGIKYSFTQASSLDVEIEETDLLLIDTLHTYDQVSQELKKHGNKSRKYILLHDTEEFKTEIGPAIQEFLVANPHWKIHEVFTNEYGLTILKRSE